MKRNRQSVIDNNRLRNDDYKLDINVENFLDSFNDAIGVINSTSSFSSYSPVFIYGLPRSGSSLLYEMICNTSDISFINNFISKFWGNPSVGIELYKLYNIEKKVGFYNSDIGKFSDSLSSPHEFMYFWDRIFDMSNNVDSSFIGDVSDSQTSIIFSEISSILSSFKNNTLFKSQYWLTYQVPLLRKIFPSAKFILIKRDPFFTSQSIYFARKKLNLSINDWWSIRPPGYQKKLSLPAIQQIAFQVNSVNDFIFNKAFKDEDLVIDYNDLCLNPSATLKDIDEFLSPLNISFNHDLCPKPFNPSTDVKVSDVDCRALNDYLNLKY